MANAFQRGQQTQQTTEANSVALDASRRRERGINALGDQFGTAALAPNEFNTVTNAVGREGQRKINQRDTALDRVIDADTRQFERANTIEDRVIAANDRQISQRNTAEDRAIEAKDRKDTDQVAATERLVGFFEAGIKNGADINDIVTRATPALMALGVSPEEIGTLAQDIGENPDLLKEMRGAINSMKSKSLTRRAIGKPIEVTNSDGSISFMQSFNDGTTEFIEGVTSRTGNQKDTSLEIAGGGLDVKLSELDRKNLKEVEAQLGEISEAKNFAETTINAAETVTRDISDIERLVAKDMTFGGASVPSSIFRVGAAIVPGTDAFEVDSLIQSVKSNIGIDQLLKIKKAGSGLGQVPQSQLETLQGLLGRLEIGRNPELLASNLNDVKASYEKIISAAEFDILDLNKRDTLLTQRRQVIEQRSFGDVGAGSPSGDDAPIPDDIDALLNELLGAVNSGGNTETDLPPTPELAGES